MCVAHYSRAIAEEIASFYRGWCAGRECSQTYVLLKARQEGCVLPARPAARPLSLLFLLSLLSLRFRRYFTQILRKHGAVNGF